MAFTQFRSSGEFDGGMEDAHDWLETDITYRMQGQKYRLVEQGDNRFKYERRYHPGVLWVFVVLLFPIGLLLLLVEKRTATIFVDLDSTESDDGTKIEIKGQAQPHMQKDIEAMMQGTPSED